jgi:hypothetical protein
MEYFKGDVVGIQGTCSLCSSVLFFRRFLYKKYTRMGAWCSPVNTSPCHGEDRGFESLRTRHAKSSLTRAVILFFYKPELMN